MSKIRVLIIDDIAETRENLRKLLSFEPDIDVVGAAGTGAKGIELAEEFEPHVVLMDINMPGMDGITATEKLLHAVPMAQVVMLSVQGETDYLRRAMLAGARDYLTKPASADELVNTIHRVFEMGKTQAGGTGSRKTEAARSRPVEEREQQERGRTIAFFSPKGGTGCTTIAVNTAIALQERLGDERRVALLDGNLQFGDVGVMLNLRPDRSMADLADRVKELDRDLLSSVMSAHGSGVKVLLAPPRPEAGESLLANPVEKGSQSAIEAILDRMQDDFDLIIADMWSWVDDVSLTLFDAASLIVLIVTPDIPAVKSARLFLELADKLDYAVENIALVVNGTGQRGSLQVSQIEKAMMPATAEIPFDDRSALAAANRGVPVVVRDRNRPMSKAIIRLSEIIHERLMAPEEEEKEETKGRKETDDVGGTGLSRLKEAFDRG
jgi:pilus assembly protein CpaE